MKLIRTEDAVGNVLCHDITQIIPGVTKDAVFRKGHIVTEEDIPVLLSVGKEHLYVWENQEGMLHENDGAEVLRRVCQGKYMTPTEAKEGKIELRADCDGLLKVDTKKLNQVNAMGQIVIASRHGNFPIKKGDKLVGMRVVPLVIEEEKMNKVEETCGNEPIFQILPFHKMKAGIVTTGSEVYHGRITDKFTPVVKTKMEEWGVEVLGNTLCDDDSKMVTEAIQDWMRQGAEMVVCTGGMSVDPDDRTPLSIRNASDEVITYGAPVLPGAMFMLAYNGDIPIMGLPGCVMYSKRTIFDLVLPRLVAGERLREEDFTVLGEGGLCLSCDICTFPNCGFGKNNV
ncbi:molybdopterin-binding protein [Clostridium sp. C105KSO13]|uniref:molybdopterin-binding protein n=1 Tax=Clostridium sp. C105KSO13 TaxID=1776045 RepID=UPI00074071B4|nr:molybdopterin-binding protein [Clostridium sp. C105KSO13]CUX39071.1 bifunctional molybdenum cofactor biosynthesis protein MoaC/MogA [Clostridium sp. C105KSO13]